MTTSGTVLSFLRPRQRTECDWTQQELAEFYRVEAALIRGGLLIDVDRGLSDEGDPWFVFCRRDNGEVIAHFARIRDQYVIACHAFSGVARGEDFATLLSELMRAYPMSLPRDVRREQNVYLHPAAMLVALIATAFMVSDHDAHDQHAPSLGKEVVRLWSLGEFAILSAVAIATTWVENQIDSVLKVLETEHVAAAKENEANHDAHFKVDLDKIVDGILKIGLQLDTHALAKDTTALTGSAEGQDNAEGHGNANWNAESHAISPAEHSLFSSNPWDKVIDLTTSVAPNAVESSGHSPWSSVGQIDTPGYYQTVVPQASSGSTQTSPAAPHSSPPVTDQVVSTTTSSASSTTTSVNSTEAYHVLGLDLGNTTNAPLVLSTSNLSLDTSIQHALAHVQVESEGPLQNAGQSPTPGESWAAAAPSLPTGSITVETSSVSDQTSSDLLPATSPLPFNDQANATLLEFMASNPNIERDVVGQHVIVIDKNGADVGNSHYGSQTWSFDDGSTLTIVGIISHSAQATAIAYK